MFRRVLKGFVRVSSLSLGLSKGVLFSYCTELITTSGKQLHTCDPGHKTEAEPQVPIDIF